MRSGIQEPRTEASGRAGSGATAHDEEKSVE